MTRPTRVRWTRRAEYLATVLGTLAACALVVVAAWLFAPGGVR